MLRIDLESDVRAELAMNAAARYVPVEADKTCWRKIMARLGEVGAGSWAPESSWTSQARWAPLLDCVDWERVRCLLGLSPRETEVAREQVLGRTQTDIAAKLGIGFGTVKTHTRRLYRKLDISNRTELALSVLTSGLECRGCRPRR